MRECYTKYRERYGYFSEFNSALVLCRHAIAVSAIHKRFRVISLRDRGPPGDQQLKRKPRLQTRHYKFTYCAIEG